MQHLGKFAWHSVRVGNGRNAYCVKARRDFQTAGLNGVFGYFCRRGQKYLPPQAECPPLTIRACGQSIGMTSRAQAHFTSQAAASVGHLPAAVSLVSIRSPRRPRRRGRCQTPPHGWGTGRSVMGFSSSVTTSRLMCLAAHRGDAPLGPPGHAPAPSSRPGRPGPP